MGQPDSTKTTRNVDTALRHMERLRHEIPPPGRFGIAAHGVCFYSNAFIRMLLFEAESQISRGPRREVKTPMKRKTQHKKSVFKRKLKQRCDQIFRAVDELKRSIQFADEGDMSSSMNILNSVDHVFDFAQECRHFASNSAFLDEMCDLWHGESRDGN